jgi:hypothetical protein
MTTLSGSDAARWHPVSVIEKYSAGQVRYAREHGEVPWSNRFGLPPRVVLTGNLMRLLFREPEDGTVEDQGNGTTVNGTANLALLLTGTGGHPLAEGQAVFGVGSDAGEFDREHVSLGPVAGEEAGRTWYRPMDPGYPRMCRPGVIEGQATFLEHEACFAWHEWCWGTGPLLATAHHSLRGCYDGNQPVMVNRRAHSAGYGEKLAGAAWCFRTEITLS